MGYSAVLLGVARPHPAYAAAGRARERKTVFFSGCSRWRVGLEPPEGPAEPPLLGRRNSNFSHPHAERTVWFPSQFAREIHPAPARGRKKTERISAAHSQGAGYAVFRRTRKVSRPVA